MIDNKALISVCEDFSLSTDRLNLRRFKAFDLSEEIKQQQDPEVVRYIREPMTTEQAVAYFEQFIQPYKGEEQEWLGICIDLKEGRGNVGAISFRLESIESEVVEIGYRFNPAFQGKGYATEAVSALVNFLFETVKIHRIVAYCDPDNAASYRVMEKLNMQREGRLREHYKVGDNHTDVYIYGLLAGEYHSPA